MPYFAPSYFAPRYFRGSASVAPTSTPTVIATKLSILLPIVQAQLATTAGLSPNQTALSFEDDPWPTIGDRFAFIKCDEQHAIEDEFSGGGRWLVGVRGVFSVDVFLRSARDQAYQDTFRILALVDLCHNVVDRLQGFFPTDSNLNILVQEPIRMLQQDRPIGFSRQGEWIRASIPFEMKYVMAVDTSIL